MFRIIFSIATVFGAWCALVANDLADSEIMNTLMGWHFPCTSIPIVAVAAFFIVYRFTFVISHKRKF